MPSTDDSKLTLLALSHELGAEQRNLAILGEGNTSARLEEETFLVKASGCNLGRLAGDDLVECRFAPLLALLDAAEASDREIDKTLMDSRVDAEAKKPSVETLFHAYLLSLPGIRYVGHVHPVSVNQILCSPMAQEFAERRIFPDEVVCCGAASVLVPYNDPGLQLARAIRDGVVQFNKEHGVLPQVILLENHGIITVGSSPSVVKTAIYMADKAARIFIGAAALGGPCFLPGEQVKRIAGRADEHYRQRMLGRVDR